ncbi:MAG: hypothetical protein WC641_03560 [Patescibacteria group bacterium]
MIDISLDILNVALFGALLLGVLLGGYIVNWGHEKRRELRNDFLRRSTLEEWSDDHEFREWSSRRHPVLSMFI